MAHIIWTTLYGPYNMALYEFSKPISGPETQGQYFSSMVTRTSNERNCTLIEITVN